MVQTFQTATHQVLYCNEEINLMFLFIACSFFILLRVSPYIPVPFVFFCYYSLFTCVFILLFHSHFLHVYILLVIGHYLHAPLCFSAYQSLHTLFILLFISHYLHVPF